jgi:two-component system, chemotaxis family, response regulator Rcp1
VPQSRPILVVEDNPGDVRLLQEAFREIGRADQLQVVANGEDALDFLFHRRQHAEQPRPELILLDINLPKVSGHQVLRNVKTHPNLKSIPVLMLTSSDFHKDIQAAYDQQANGYLRKPVDLAEYFDVVAQIETYRTVLPAQVKASVFWVNSAIRPQSEWDPARRVIGTPIPFHEALARG